MLSPLRNRFGIPGVISVIALVFAMMGGAYAATNGNPLASTSKAKKGPRGPKGSKGDAGPAGPQGPAGANGKDGANGSNGSPGANGKSVLSASFTGLSEPAGEPCEERGGSSFEVEGSGVKRYACNGENGEEGEEGSPWTASGTLPPGATETGVWGTLGPSPTPGTLFFPISFTLPLNVEPDVIFLKEGEDSTTGCPGQVNGIPKADPGKLCVYGNLFSEVSSEGFLKTVSEFTEPGANKTGTLFKVKCEGFCFAAGTWAVTAPAQ